MKNIKLQIKKKNINFLNILLQTNILNQEYTSSNLKTNLNFDPLLVNYIDINPNSFFYIFGIFFLFLMQFVSIWEFFSYYDELYSFLIFQKLKFWLHLFNNIFFFRYFDGKKKILYFFNYIFWIIFFELFFFFFLFFYFKLTLLNISVILCFISILISILIFLITSNLYNFDFQKDIILLKKKKIKEIEKELNMLKIKLQNNKKFKNNLFIDLEIKKLKIAKLLEIENKYKLKKWWKEKIAILPNPKTRDIPVLFYIHFRKPGILQLFFILVYIYYIYICYFNSFNFFSI